MIDPSSVLLPPSSKGVPIQIVTAGGWKAARAGLGAEGKAWADANALEGESGRMRGAASRAFCWALEMQRMRIPLLSDGYAACSPRGLTRLTVNRKPQG